MLIMGNELRIKKHAEDVAALFKEIDQAQAEFASASGIACLPGCGKCCYNPEIEISPLEVYPWALEIIKRGEAEKYLELLAGHGSAVCFFYRYDLNDPTQGCCDNYHFRPLLCRLFGCSILPDKFGDPRPVLCKLVKKADPDLENRVTQLTKKGINAPVFNTYYTRLAGIDHFFGNARLPINRAFADTLQKISYLAELETLF